MEFARRIVRDPLVHFLIAGAALFLLWGVLNPEDSRSADEKTIIVDRAALLKYMQYRSQAFEPEYFIDAYNAMTAGERQQLADTYVREEAMARQAKAMGLDDVDYVIRQRLVQKMLFIIDSGDAAGKPNEGDLAAWFARHRDEYRTAETVSFTHVFVDNEKKHPEGGKAAAERLKAQLNAAHAGFNDAPRYGDRFPYLQNYLDRDPGFVTNQFGQGFAVALRGLKPSGQWQGPIESSFGWHVVLVTKRTAAAAPSLAQVRDQVESDYQAERNVAARRKAIDDLLTYYDIRVVGVPGVVAPGAAK